MNEQEIEELAEREAALKADEERRATEAAAAKQKGWPVQTTDGVVYATRNVMIGQLRVIVTATGARYQRDHTNQVWTPLDAGPPQPAAPAGQEPIPDPEAPVDPTVMPPDGEEFTTSSPDVTAPKRTRKPRTTKKEE